MNDNLLIVGASTYAMLASEIASDIGCFEKIDFVDDEKITTPNGIKVIGKICDIEKLSAEYNNIIVAIGDPERRMLLLNMIKEDMKFKIISLVSPKAYVSSSARIESGCIIEPMAVIQARCVIETGCIISSGAVINHESVCSECVHIDCNATVEGFCVVPSGAKVHCGEIYKK